MPSPLLPGNARALFYSDQVPSVLKIKNANANAANAKRQFLKIIGAPNVDDTHPATVFVPPFVELVIQLTRLNMDMKTQDCYMIAYEDEPVSGGRVRRGGGRGQRMRKIGVNNVGAAAEVPPNVKRLLQSLEISVDDEQGEEEAGPPMFRNLPIDVVTKILMESHNILEVDATRVVYKALSSYAGGVGAPVAGIYDVLENAVNATAVYKQYYKESCGKDITPDIYIQWIPDELLEDMEAVIKSFEDANAEITSKEGLNKLRQKVVDNIVRALNEVAQMKKPNQRKAKLAEVQDIFSTAVLIANKTLMTPYSTQIPYEFWSNVESLVNTPQNLDSVVSDFKAFSEEFKKILTPDYFISSHIDKLHEAINLLRKYSALNCPYSKDFPKFPEMPRIYSSTKYHSIAAENYKISAALPTLREFLENVKRVKVNPKAAKHIENKTHLKSTTEFVEVLYAQLNKLVEIAQRHKEKHPRIAMYAEFLSINDINESYTRATCKISHKGIFMEDHGFIKDFKKFQKILTVDKYRTTNGKPGYCNVVRLTVFDTMKWPELETANAEAKQYMDELYTRAFHVGNVSISYCSDIRTGGSAGRTMPKYVKTPEKKLVMGRNRVVYMLGRKKYVKVLGEYYALRRVPRPSEKTK